MKVLDEEKNLLQEKLLKELPSTKPHVKRFLLATSTLREIGVMQESLCLGHGLCYSRINQKITSLPLVRLTLLKSGLKPPVKLVGWISGMSICKILPLKDSRKWTISKGTTR